MPLRKTQIAPNECYHLLNRGNQKQNLFVDQRDWIRFLFLVLYFQSPERFFNLSRPVTNYVRSQAFNMPEKRMDKIVQTRELELINFCLMPNHLHLTVKNLTENGVSRYMQRVETAYAKYFNAKYEKTGHLFQGPFKAVRITSNEQMLHLSAYIHRNPREIAEWKNREENYPWSSFQDYTKKNRWGRILKTDIILDQFSNPKEYKEFLDTSGTKTKLDMLDAGLLTDG